MRLSLTNRITTLAWTVCWIAGFFAGTGAAVAQKPGSTDGRDPLAGYPEVTLLIEVKDARKAASLVQKAGGEVLYDPNLGVGHDIPFLVVNLPGDKVVDEAFIKSLELRSGGATFHGDANCGCKKPPEQKQEPLNFDSLFVPVEDINLPKLRARAAGDGRGKGIIVAVIDTGVDASHPVFQDRVIYWGDATREGRVKLEKVKVIEGKVTFQEKPLTIPKRLAENKEVFVGVFDETEMGIQVPDFVKANDLQGLDFNRNESVKDKFLIVIGADIPPAADPTKKPETKPDSAKPEAKPAEPEKKADEPKKPAEAKPVPDPEAPPEPEEAPETPPAAGQPSADKAAEKPAEAAKPADAKPADAAKPAEAKPAESKPPLIAFIDIDGNGQFDGKEGDSPIMDFNDARKLKRDGKELKFAEMLVFPSRTKTIAYPLLFRADERGNVEHATLAAAFISHGTHVAGIIAGNGEEIVGAAPEAEIMAIKTCSGWSCTEAAIIRGILEAFNNPLGYVPDVVNISLGSPEGYHKDRMDVLIQDLCAKYGTTFFVSASNSGTGYRSINHIGSLSPAVLVGAHVSRSGLSRHYRLQEGVEVPEHGLLAFSSVGPSYTGQLRPNIVAPGSALSATALIDDGSSMYNGTSMSSPLACGATAALLSLARKHESFAKIETMRQEKIKAVKEKSATAGKYSLTTVPLLIRTALEESAKEMPDFTMAQQGHGLLDIDAAYDSLLELTAKVNGGFRFTEFKINDNAEAGRLYDRSNDIPPVKRVGLTLDSDGELNEVAWLKFRNAATEVRLVRVEVQNIDGTVERLVEPGDDGFLPFSIAVPGKEGQQGRSIVLGLANDFKSSFSSVRRLEMMQAGKTYLAQYDVFQFGQRLVTLLDVVHKPIELSDLPTEVNLPGIEVEESKRPGTFVSRNQKIKALTFHRYPVAVTTRDSAINVQLGFGKEDDGLLMVQAYDPDGYETDSRVIRKSPQLTSEDRTVEMVVPTLEKKGIWEITVSSFSPAWIGDSGYDLLIEAYRFVPSFEQVQLGTKSAPQPAPGSERVLSLMNSSRQVGTVSVMLSNVERIAPMKPFGIAPNHRTYKKVPLPPVDSKQAGSRATTIVLELDPLSKINDHVAARIDHQLYKRGPDGKFVTAIRADRGGGSGRRVFRNVPRPVIGAPPEDYFAAVETMGVFPDGPSLSEVIDHVDMIVVLPEIPVQLVDGLRADYLGADSTADVKLIKVSAPSEITDESTPAKSRGSTAKLKVETGDPNLPEITVDLPVTLTDKPRPSGGRALERARATLNISTNHPNISASVPIVVSQ